jgi:hypothetical protein
MLNRVDAIIRADRHITTQQLAQETFPASSAWQESSRNVGQA